MAGACLREGTVPDRATVLVVDDEPLSRLVIADEISDEGYNVVQAANADEAMAVLQSEVGIDLLVTDIQMPGSMDGIGLATLVRHEFPSLKIVLVSGYKPAIEGPQSFDGFFPKPCDFQRLCGHLNELLAR